MKNRFAKILIANSIKGEDGLGRSIKLIKAEQFGNVIDALVAENIKDPSINEDQLLNIGWQ